MVVFILEMESDSATKGENYRHQCGWISDILKKKKKQTQKYTCSMILFIRVSSLIMVEGEDSEVRLSGFKSTFLIKWYDLRQVT